MIPRPMLISFALGACSAVPAAAQSVPVALIEECLELSNAGQSLDCVEGLLPEGDASPSQAPAAAAQPAANPWTLLENSDPINGTNTSSAYLDAKRQLNGRDSPEYMMLRCDGNGGFELFIGTEGYIGGRRDRVAMEYRWNDDPPISENWADSTNGKAAFLPRGYRDFLAGLRAGGDLVVRWQDYRGNMYASRWDNVQLDDNARFILDGC